MKSIIKWIFNIKLQNHTSTVCPVIGWQISSYPTLLLKLQSLIFFLVNVFVSTSTIIWNICLNNNSFDLRFQMLQELVVWKTWLGSVVYQIVDKIDPEKYFHQLLKANSIICVGLPWFTIISDNCYVSWEGLEVVQMLDEDS